MCDPPSVVIINFSDPEREREKGQEETDRELAAMTRREEQGDPGDPEGR